MTRLIVVGLAARRITGRVPVAELVTALGRACFFAQLFAELRQLGCAIPAGVEVAYHATILACDRLGALADGDDSEMPSPGDPDRFRERLQQCRPGCTAGSCRALPTAPPLQHSLLSWAGQSLCY